MWKLIPGSEKYEASTEGHIRNKKLKKYYVNSFIKTDISEHNLMVKHKLSIE